MKDAIELIGKTINIKSVDYTIVKVYFVPNAINDNHNLYFGLTRINETIVINYSYHRLLPYIKRSINRFGSSEQ